MKCEIDAFDKSQQLDIKVILSVCIFPALKSELVVVVNTPYCILPFLILILRIKHTTLLKEFINIIIIIIIFPVTSII